MQKPWDGKQKRPSQSQERSAYAVMVKADGRADSSDMQIPYGETKKQDIGASKIVQLG
jgi:hypothetical protein